MKAWADRYEILGTLGAGGNGDVYRVKDLKLGRELALKLLGGGEEILVVREAHALTALESPHVLRVFNAGVHGDVPFLATDVAPMGSTENQIVDGLGVPPGLAVRWVRQALVGLDYCHRRNILHRDITPGNIFLNTVDHALIGDFGTACNLDENGTAPPAGNQRCRAPEGYSDRLTTKSDIFSVGASLWRLLTGAWPFDAPTEAELAAMMQDDARPRLRDTAPHVHASIAGVVEGALRPDPDARSDAATMARRLADARTHPLNWSRLPSATGQVEYRSANGARALVLTVTESGRRRYIETRHVGSGRRVTAGCLESTRANLPRDFDGSSTTNSCSLLVRAPQARQLGGHVRGGSTRHAFRDPR